MPSSLIFVALAVAWLVVLVPMVARRRQEVSRTADSALQARVLRRGGASRPAGRATAVAANSPRGEASAARVKEVFAMPNPDLTEDVDEDELESAYAEHDTGGAGEQARRQAKDEHEDYDDEEYEEYEDEPLEPRAYRPGRGGFDPETAELTARAKYAFRQRVVVFILLLAVVSGVLAALMTPMIWWAHGALDVVLLGYLTYLRRQVRIEEDIRQRRLSRLSHARRRRPEPVQHSRPVEAIEVDEGEIRMSPAVSRPGAVRVEIDDEDPVFDELEAPAPISYRRAVGE